MHPALAPLDYAIIGAYVAFALSAGLWFRRRTSRGGAESFFVGDRKLPWWIAGTSIVATTFAADTPLAVTGIVAADGISGNWIWWTWAIAHLTATFFFARMWRRSGVVTDAEITELRYSGRPAAALRGFKAVYFGLFVNCLTMAWVIAAMVKISRAFFDVEPAVVVALCVAVSATYTLLGGFRSVVVTDLVQFALGMGGAILLSVLVVQQMGGIGEAPVAPSEATTAETGTAEAGSGLLGAVAQAVEENGEWTLDDVLDFVPPKDHPTLPWIYFAVLLTVGWWRYAEGNGYIVQRLAASRDEGHAQGASLWFSVAHNALRPWPWILVGLAALVIYPQLPGQAPESLRASLTWGQDAESLRLSPASLDVATGGTLWVQGLPESLATAECRGILQETTVLAEAPSQGPGEESGRALTFPRSRETGLFPLTLSCGAAEARFEGLRVELHDREMAYPLILGRTLPVGLLGLVVASLLAAFMSTIDTHTNWGASYLVQDLYRRFFRPEAPARHYVAVSRGAIVLMAVLAGVAALFIQDIASVWRFLISLGAGLGSVTAARWYWPRVTAWAEFAALAVTTVVAVGLELIGTPTLFGGPNPFFQLALPAWQKILAVAACSLAAWVPVALLGPRDPDEHLRLFARRVRPAGPGWRQHLAGRAEPLGPLTARFIGGLAVVFGSLFGIGELLLGSAPLGAVALAVATGALLWIVGTPPETPAAEGQGQREG